MTRIYTAADLTIAMITLNEEKAIAKVVADLQSVAPGAEILVVDSSSDSTADIAENLGCRVIRQLPPQGYGPAMGMALRSAKRDVVITIDCDDTYPVEAIPLLLEKINDGFDLVSASRLRTRPKAMSLQNYLANRVFASLAGLLCAVQTTDVHTGMRAYTRDLLRNFPFDPHGMALPVELLVGPASKGYRFAELFIDYRERIGISTLMPLPGTLWTLRRLWRFRRFARQKRSKEVE